MTDDDDDDKQEIRDPVPTAPGVFKRAACV
jgi:hypothetical protein